jgi:hypothetical protein
MDEVRCNCDAGRLLQAEAATGRTIVDDVISPLHFMRGLGMIAATVIVQTITQIALSRFMEAVPPPRPSGRHLNHLGVAYIMAPVLILVIGMIGEVALWALLYYSWGDHDHRRLRALAVARPSHHRRDRSGNRYADVRLVGGVAVRRDSDHAQWAQHRVRVRILNANRRTCDASIDAPRLPRAAMKSSRARSSA